MTEIHFDFLNLNSLLIILLILLIGGYLYYEIYKLKVIINEIQYASNPKHDPFLQENIPTMTENIIEIPKTTRTLISEEDNEWNHIHRQMNHNDENDAHESTYSENPPREISEDKISEDKQDLTRSDNTANIDEILEGKNIITDNSLSDILNVDSDLTKIDEFINTIKASEGSKIISTNYDKMTISQLKKILSDKDLPVSGNKTKLIQRIKENSESSK